jgi:tRNA threonylcarbamoyladenosine biosynthesis protein TsaB
MKLLAIDTSTEYLVLAVTEDGKTLARLHRKAPKSHSSLLMPMIEKLLKKARLGLGDIDGFCVGVGPGSFTGLRIGVATVKGLAYVTGKPVAAVPTFDAIARNGKLTAGIICPVLDARKQKVYGCFYRSDGRGSVKRISRYLLLPVQELLKRCEKYDNLYLLGDYAERMAPLLAKAKIIKTSWHPKAEEVSMIALDNFNKGRVVSVERLEPMYIYSRECDITGN